MTDTNPLALLQGNYVPDSYWPDEYLAGATPMLADWLTRPLTDVDHATVERVLDGLHETGLDVTDVFPFGLVWALRSTGAIEGTPPLDASLAQWRTWEETDHLCEPMPFLPALPEGPNQ